MEQTRRRYRESHWLRSKDPEEAVRACMEQQSKAYSRIKTQQVLELLGDLKGARLIDYGCGIGFFTVLAAKAGASLVVGVEAESSALASARHFALREGVEENCRFLCSSRFPQFRPQTRFNAVLLKDVIEHVEDDRALLQSAADALAPGSVLVLVTQNKLSLNYLLEGAYHRILRSEKDWYGWDPTHLRFYTPRNLESALKRTGFRCLEWRSAYLLPYKLPPLPFSKKPFFRIDGLSLVDILLGRRFPFNRFGWSLAVKAVRM